MGEVENESALTQSNFISVIALYVSVPYSNTVMAQLETQIRVSATPCVFLNYFLLF